MLTPDDGRTRPATALSFRPEDWMLAGFVAILSPAVALVEGVAGPFDGGHPVAGLVRIVGACAGMACLATRNSDRSDDGEPLLTQATGGPVIGGIALVGASGLACLGLPPEPALGLAFIGLLLLSPLQSHLPAIPVARRRQLCAPFLLAAGGIFWSLIDYVGGATNVPGQIGGAPQLLALTLGILIVASAIYYAMLIYAPRQIVEREGTPLIWLRRYGLFVVSVAFGVTWLGVLGI